MDIKKWNHETRQAYVGTLIYSLLGILLAAVIVLGGTANVLAGGSGFLSTLLVVIVEIGIVAGYVIFFLAVKDLKTITEGEDKKAFEKVYISVLLNVVAVILAMFKLTIISGAFALAACLLLVWGYYTLKKSTAIAEFSPAAISGFGLLFTAEVLVLVGIVLEWIPVVSVIAGILEGIAWVLVILGWKKVATPVAVPGEEPVAEKPLFDTIKGVVVESVAEAKESVKDVKRDATETMKEVAGDVKEKAKEAKKDAAKKVQEAADKVSEKAKKADEKAEDLSEKAEEKVEEVVEKLEEAADKLEEKAEKVADKLEDKVEEVKENVKKKLD